MKQGQRDEYGLELIDGIFSPVASVPSRPGNDAIDNVLVGVEKGQSESSRDILGVGLTSTALETTTTTTVLTDRRLNNNNHQITPGKKSNSILPPPPPPRSRSPIKTNLNSSPRRPPSSPSKSRPGSPPYQGLNGTPRRGIPHPSSAAKRKPNLGENVVRPIVRSSPTVVRRVSPRRFQATPSKKDSPRSDVNTGERKDEIQNTYQTSPRFSDAMADERDNGDKVEKGDDRDHAEDDRMGQEMVDSFQPLTRHATEQNANDVDDMDDSMQLVQYDDDRGEQDNQISTNDHLPSPGNIPYGQDDPESDRDYVPTPGVTPFRPASNKPQAIQHQTSESPAHTTFPMKRGRGRPPKARTLVYQDFRDSDLEDDQSRPRKVIRNDQDSYLSASEGNAFSKPIPTSLDLNARLSMNESGMSITPQKRGPGRPRKIRFDGSTPVVGGSSSQPLRGDNTDNNGQVVKRKRGRPRKSDSVSNTTPMVVTSQGSQWVHGDIRGHTVIDEEWSNGVRWSRLDDHHPDLNQRMERHSDPIDPVLLGSLHRRDIPPNDITYSRGSSLIPTISQPPPSPLPQATTMTTTENPAPLKRGRGRPKGSKNKPKHGSSQPGQPSSRVDPLEPWEEDPGIITGAVRLWDSELESSLDYLVEEGRFVSPHSPLFPLHPHTNVYPF